MGKGIGIFLNLIRIFRDTNDQGQNGWNLFVRQKLHILEENKEIYDLYFEEALANDSYGHRAKRACLHI